MSTFLLVNDVCCVGTSILAAIILWGKVRGDLQVEAHLAAMPMIILLFILANRFTGLYPAIGVGPVEELKRLTINASFILLALLSLSFLLRSTLVYSRAVLSIAWVLMLISIPLSRKIFRRIAHALGMWGIPIAIIGGEKNVMDLHEYLKLHPLSGLWPVLCISGTTTQIFPSTKNRQMLLSQIDTVMLVTDEGKFDAVHYLITQRKHRLKRILVIFDEAKVGPIWFNPIHLVGHMGLEVPHNLLNPGQRFIKRFIELMLIFCSLPILLALFALISLVVKSSSPGPVFYKHKRIGLDGRTLWIWKFRTMIHNADKILDKHLTNDPVLHKEWTETFKLRNDPRVTQIGKLLRLTSLDELPQLWNVLKGEMSLIGPRPIVEDEIHLYGDDFEIYKQVLPGITGLWQISGRNNLPYQERVALDVYYIQNWSIWLDVHILMHTALAALQARGAY